MEIYANWALVWLVAVSIVAVLVTMWDKWRARRREWRVPERTLWLVAALGGAAAMYATMCVLRHKTRHRAFMIGMPLLMLVQAGAIFGLCRAGLLIFV